MGPERLKMTLIEPLYPIVLCHIDLPLFAISQIDNV